MRAINDLVIHCSATKADVDVGVTEIDRWHRARNPPFDMIGYHFVIRRNGALEYGRPVPRQGAHVEGHNAHSIAVCLVGGIGEDGRPVSNYTASQWWKLSELTRIIVHIYPWINVCGHRDYIGVAKACPCFDVKAWWRERTR